MLTLYEYEAQMYAYGLKKVDKEYYMHLQSWLNHQVTTMKEQGKKQVPVYKNFKDFYDYEKELNEVKKLTQNKTLTSKQKELANLAKKVNERR